MYGDPLTFGQGARIAELAMRHRLPTLHFFREGVEAGGLLSFGPDLPHIWRNVGKYVDKILKGAKPGDIPVEQPSKYELVINMKTAKALGLTAVGFAGCSMRSHDRALWALRTWLDSWPTVGHVAAGMHRQGFDLQLTQYDERGWPATF